ncbi:MAG: hypothetical protein J7K21_01085 [Desulfurococcales archaeon]|nr:hypothetical protein [Desulfurococcales archaeon]
MSKVIVPPVVVEIDGAKVYILEVTPHNWVDKKKHYIVSCYVEWNGWRSQVFQLDVTSNKELKAKLKTEIAKMKLAILSGNTHFFTKVK